MVAGINHFIHPEGYISIIPAYMPYPKVLNLLAGLCEMSFALMLAFEKTRAEGAFWIIMMLIAFLPVHIGMIVHAPMKMGGLLVTPLMAWLRIPLQVLLILWAWWYANPNHAKHSRVMMDVSYKYDDCHSPG